ncbi:FGGY-family carbohydrate kinase, partial [Escherichia albertii]|nr:FGGY-family carbohydrate kinase [Escherichia albertii]
FSGYLTHRLTGEFKDNIANYFGQWPVDYKTWAWSEDAAVMEKFNIPRQMLFDVQMPGTVLGHITPQAALATHFPAGLPVVCTTSDKPVEALGAGLLDDETAVISLGTYIALMMNGKALDLSPEDLLNKKASCVPPGCNGLMTVLDWLTNPWEPYKRGIMIGFDSSMDYAWIYRSILESVALTLKNNYDNMCNEMNHFAKHVIITGGGSNSDLFMQIFADVFNLPARRNAINGCASLGAAINTTVGLGLYPDYATAVDKMVRVKDVFMPVESNAKRYDAMNKGIFKDLTKHTDVILKKSYEVMHGELGNADSIQSWSNA